MPIGGRSSQNEESNTVQNAVRGILDAIESIFHQEMTLEEFVQKASEELDAKILQEVQEGNAYVAGRLQLQCENEVFLYSFSMYFKTANGIWTEIKGQSHSIPLNYFNEDARLELQSKKELVYDIEEPVQKQDTKSVSQTQASTVPVEAKAIISNEDFIQETSTNIQQELDACREYAKRGFDSVQESYEKMISALAKERKKLREADRQQNQLDRLQNDKQFAKQLNEMTEAEQEIKRQVKSNINDLKNRQDAFTIVLYGRTMAGKSTLMEILTHGNGASIGKGAQRTTLDVRPYTWNGLKIFDVPGTCSFGGDVDDKLAFEAAKSADMALFLLTDDAPQPSEADRLAELKELGKPILGIVNVKQVLSPEPTSAKRKIDVKALSKKINDQTRLDEIVQQFKDFAKKSGHDFSDIQFVSAHLKAAYLSQPERENDATLYRLSNFSAVENFILEKVRKDGRFICYKTFLNSAAIPMQQAIAMFYRHSSESLRAYLAYNEKIEMLDEWREKFFESTQSRYNTFMEGIENKLDTEINYVVNNYYESSEAGDAWQRRVEGLNLNRLCQNFISKIGEDATRKMRELSDELTQDLQYSGASVNIPRISMEEITDWQGGLMMAAPLLAFTPVGWVGAAVVGIGSWLFGDSKEEKIRQQKNELRDKLQEPRDEIVGNIRDAVIKILNEDILHEQIDGFRETLYEMREMIARLAYEQNNVADTINEQFRDLNYDLFGEAVKYADSCHPKEIFNARIVGKEFVIFTVSEISSIERQTISNLLNENISVFTISKEKYWEELFNAIELAVLHQEYTFLPMERDWGNMNIISLSQESDVSDEQIQIAQQLSDSPVVRE